MHPSGVILAALFLMGSVLAYTEVYDNEGHYHSDNYNDKANISDWPQYTGNHYEHRSLLSLFFFNVHAE